MGIERRRVKDGAKRQATKPATSLVPQRFTGLGQWDWICCGPGLRQLSSGWGAVSLAPTPGLFWLNGNAPFQGTSTSTSTSTDARARTHEHGRTSDYPKPASQPVRLYLACPLDPGPLDPGPLRPRPASTPARSPSPRKWHLARSTTDAPLDLVRVVRVASGMDETILPRLSLAGVRLSGLVRDVRDIAGLVRATARTPH